jgi:hypothetical protein
MRPPSATILRTLWLVVCVVFLLPMVVSVSNLPIYLPLGGATASLAIQAVYIVGWWWPFRWPPHSCCEAVGSEGRDCLSGSLNGYPLEWPLRIAGRQPLAELVHHVRW